MATDAVALMGSTTLPARWEGKLAWFGPVEKGPARLHWYQAGSTSSACGNYQRSPLICLSWSEEQSACPRCVEELVRVGEPVPPLPEPPAGDDDDDQDDGDEDEPS